MSIYQTAAKGCKIATVIAAMFASGVAYAVTKTGNMAVEYVVATDCTLTTTNTLDFGSSAVPPTANTNNDVNTNITVNCNLNLPYNIGIDDGANPAGGTRNLTDATGTSTDVVAYGIFRDAAYAAAWGTTIGTDTLTGTGTGADVVIPVYGRLPAPPATLAAATYTDTVAVTITY